MTEQQLWVGTGSLDGIQVLEFQQGVLRCVAKGGPPNTTYLVKGPEDLVLACVESDCFDGKVGGGVVSCRLQGDTVEVRGSVAQLASGICHVCYGPRRKLVFAASYPTGIVEVLRITEGGSLVPEKRILPVETICGPHPEQTGFHAHFCAMTSQETLVYVCDLGTDLIARYELENFKALSPFHMPAGSGPRHLLISKDEKYIYVVCELSNEVILVDAEKGTVLQRVFCKREEGLCALSSIRYSNDGRSLLIGSRVQDGIWVLPLTESGMLDKATFYAIEGKWPWDVISFESEHLAAALYHSHRVEVGTLNGGSWDAGISYDVEKPTCLLLV